MTGLCATTLCDLDAAMEDQLLFKDAMIKLRQFIHKVRLYKYTIF
jgi:hypothetical protein